MFSSGIFPILSFGRIEKKKKVACLVSLKRPPFNGYALKLMDEVRDKADDVGARFFATWNVNHFVLWETFEEGTLPPEGNHLHSETVHFRI